MLAAYLGSGLSGAGLLANGLAPRSVANLRGRLSHLKFGLASSGSGGSLALTGSHLAQCIIWGIRASSSQVEPLYVAIDTLITLFVILDILASWAFVATHGILAIFTAVLNGHLLLDCFVVTAPLALFFKDAAGERTWFSFSWLAAIRLLRVLGFMQQADAHGSNSNWRRQILYSLLMMALFVYTCAAGLLTLELLGTPALAEDGALELPTAVHWAVSMLFTLGDTDFEPRSMCGRVFAMFLSVFAVFNLLTRVVPLMFDELLGRGLGYGRYRPRRLGSGGHVVVFGTPTAPMLWDFLQEIYHPNHFHDQSSFDREAPDVVVLVPSERTLAHLRRFLGRLESLPFRDRVKPLVGDVFSTEDLQRVVLRQARRAIVLPNLTAVDVADDDHQNSMRMFRISSFAPHVHALCLLHCAGDLRAEFSAIGGASVLLSVDSFKLSLMANACLTPGTLPLVTNLCTTFGNKKTGGRPWEQEYQHGVGCELYEVPLSAAYHDTTFSQVFEDVLARAQNADVYLIGVVQLTPKGPGLRSVYIHPGAKTRLTCKDGTTAGVFVAPDLSAVRQCQAGKELLHLGDSSRGIQESIDQASSPHRSGRSGSPSTRRMTQAPVQSQVVEFQSPTSAGANGLGSNPPSAVVTLRNTADAQATKPDGGATTQEMLFSPQWEHNYAEKSYKSAMARVQHRLLCNGFSIGTVAEVTGKLHEGGKLKNWDVGFGSAARPRLAQRFPGRSDAVPEPSTEPGEWQLDSEVEAMAQLAGAQDRREAMRVQHLARLYAICDHVEAEILSPSPLPAALLRSGGHLLLCVVGETSCTDYGSYASGPGPEIGIGYFVRPLRDQRVQGLSMHPAVVVLAVARPADWYEVVGSEQVYFMQGSPMNLEDLERAGFCKARAIAVVRGHRADVRHCIATKAVDARVVLTSQLIEKHLPSNSKTPVITDHAYLGSCSFLRTNMLVEVTRGEPALHVGEVTDPPKLLPGFLAGLMGLSTSRQETALPEDCSLCSGSTAENYEALEFTDYLHHPLFMKGQVFLASVLTALAASTVYNPSLGSLVNELLQVPMLILPLPQALERRTYAECVVWLLRNKNLLAVGIYRSAAAADVGALGVVGSLAPTHHYVFTGPPGRSTLLLRSDQLLCLVPR